MIYLLVFPSALIFCAPLLVYVFLCDTSLLPIKRSRVISTYMYIVLILSKLRRPGQLQRMLRQSHFYTGTRFCFNKAKIVSVYNSGAV